MRTDLQNGSSSRKLPLRKRLYRRVASAVFAFFYRIAVHKSAEQIDAMGKKWGNRIFKYAESRRRTAVDNLTTAYGKEKTPEEIRELARKSIVHFTTIMLEFMWARGKSPEEIENMVDVENMEAFDRGAAFAK